MPPMDELRGTNRYQSYEKWTVWVVTGFAVLAGIAAVLLPIFLHPWTRPFRGLTILMWAIMLFVWVFACLLLYGAAVHLTGWRLYGESKLEVTRYPDEQKRTLAGKIVAGRQALNLRQFDLKLSERRMRRPPTTSHWGSMEHEVWSLQQRLGSLDLKRESGRCVIPFEFDLADTPEPPEDTPEQKTVWMLEVTGTGPLPKYHSVFTLSSTGRLVHFFG